MSAASATLPSEAEANSQSSLNLLLRFCHPSVLPTYPQERRTNGTSAPKASHVLSLCAVRNSCPEIWATLAVLPHPPTFRCGDSSTKRCRRCSKSASLRAALAKIGRAHV